MTRSHKRPRAICQSIMEVLEQRKLLSVTIQPIGAVRAPDNKPIIIPVTATDTNANGTVSYSVSSSNPKIKAQLHTGNPYLRLTVSETVPGSSSTSSVTTTLGTMTFQLLQDLAPKTVKTIVNMVKGKFYDGLTFHRIANLAGSGQPPEFIVQGGDPAGNGSGGPGFQFRDEFNLGAMFTGKGQLAMANSGDDTNGSQFFITAAPTRHLDFNHTIWGQLVRGFDVLTKLTQEQVNSTTSAPNNTLKITSAEIVQDKTDAVLTVWAPAGAKGNVVVTGRDGKSVYRRTIKVSGIADSTNEPAFMDPLPEHLQTGVNEPISFDVSGTDFEKDSAVFTGNISSPFASGKFVGHTVVITPGQDFSGILTVKISVLGDGSLSSQADTDTVQIGVGDSPVKAAKMRTLRIGEGSSRSGFVVATFGDADPNGKASDWTAKINWGDGHQTTGTITQSGKKFVITAAPDSSTTTNYYKTNGVWPVTVDISGNLGAFKRLTGKAIVRDAPLSATAPTLVGTAGTALTGAVVASFTDADARGTASQYKSTIDWGDGTVDHNGFGANIATVSTGGFKAQGTHTYATPGVKHVTVTIEDTGGAKTSIKYDAYIAGPSNGNAITLSLGTDTATNENSVWTRDIAFTDTNPSATQWHAYVDYKDANQPDGLLPVTVNAANKTVHLSHKYIDNVSGGYSPVIIVVNDKGDVGQLSFTHTVNDVAPTITIKTNKTDTEGVAGLPMNVTFSATDTSPKDIPGLHYQIDWGDGSAALALSAGTTTATHAFSKTSTGDGFTVTVTVYDKDNLTGTATYKAKILATREIDDPAHAGKKILQIGGTGPTSGATTTTGNDTIQVNPDAASGGFNVLLNGTSAYANKYNGRVQIYAGGGDDKITVDPTIQRSFELFGGDGKDTLTAGRGDDTLNGGAGDDSLVGGNGDNYIDAGDGNDTVDGGSGNDIVLGGEGGDSIRGGDGKDLLIGQGSFFSTGDTIDGGNGDDIVIGPGFSSATPPSEAAIKSILAEWTGKGTYAQHLSHLQGPTAGRNTIFLSTTTLSNEYSADSLTGGAGNDLFFADTTSSFSPDKVNDKSANETVITI